MSLTDRPVRNDGHLYPRLITAVVEITDHRGDTTGVRPEITRIVLSCPSHDLDPEWRSPVFWFDQMLDDDERGRRLRADMADWADEDGPDAMRVTVWCDGVWLLDESGCHAADGLRAGYAQAERRVVNP